VGIRLVNGTPTIAGRCDGGSTPICHWVVITGVSSPGEPTDEMSVWNWVRIYNPFTNHTEHYRWWSLKQAWEHTAGNYMGVVVGREPE
jgi:hypothetical protein